MDNNQEKNRQAGGDNDKSVYLLKKIIHAKKSFDTAVTDFLNPDEQTLVSRLCIENGMQAAFYGGNGEYERAAAVISNDVYNGEIPVEVVKISGNFKFEKLDHRDYLGAVLSLGIKREKIGDINLYEDGAEIWVSSDIGSYICQNLNKIKHTGIKTDIIDISAARQRVQEYKILKINVASLRIDSVAASLTGSSRSKACDYLKAGNVKINFVEVYQPDQKVENGDMVSIKGYGRYKIASDGLNTKSGRINIEVKKYI